MSDRPDVFTDSAGATHTAHDCRWITSSIYAGFDACLVNPVAHYRESGAEARATAPLDIPTLRDALRRVYKSRYHERFAEPLAAEYARLAGTASASGDGQ